MLIKLWIWTIITCGNNTFYCWAFALIYGLSEQVEHNKYNNKLYLIRIERLTTRDWKTCGPQHMKWFCVLTSYHFIFAMETCSRELLVTIKLFPSICFLTEQQNMFYCVPSKRGIQYVADHGSFCKFKIQEVL